MSPGLAGRAMATAGIMCGLLVIGLEIVSFPNGFSARHVSDGTAVAFLLVTIALASHFPAEIGADLRGAALGAAAFGFLLFVPAHQAFDQLDTLGAGAWLGLCTLLIPLGLLLVRQDHPAPAAAPVAWTEPGLLGAALGAVLIVVGVWCAVDSGGPSYWSSSHTLGILLLIAAAASLLLLPRAHGELALLVVAATFGLTVYAWVYHAFERLGSLGAGGWLEAVGGVLLLLGVLAVRRAPATAAAPEPAAAQ
jgi:hypothetical protein